MKKLIIISTLLFLSSCFKTEIKTTDLPLANGENSFTMKRQIEFISPLSGNYGYYDSDEYAEVPSALTYPNSMGYIVPIDLCLREVKLEYNVTGTSFTFHVLVNDVTIDAGTFNAAGPTSGTKSENFDYRLYPGDKIIYEFTPGSIDAGDKFNVTLRLETCD